MKKILSVISLLFFVGNLFQVGQTNASLLFSDFKVNSLTTIQTTNNDSIVSFSFIGVNIGALSKNYAISMPAGFQYISNVNNSTCSSINLSPSNSSFDFSVNEASDCDIDLIFNYKIANTTATGLHTIYIYEGATNIASVDINISGNNNIIAASTIDTNNNGFVDTYKLTFSTGVTGTFDNSGLTVSYSGVYYNPTLSGSAAGNTAYISFPDNVWDSGITPQILDTDGGMFSSTPVISNNDIIETDGAKPILKTFNGANYNTGSVSLTGTSNIDLGFSEDLNIGDTNTNFILKDKDNTSITGTLSINGTGITFNPNNTLYSDKNPFSLGGITDWAGNVSSTLSINIIDNVAPTGDSIGLTNTGVRIDYGNNYTNSASGIVNLSLSGSDDTAITQMILSNDIGFTSSSWQAYSTGYSWTLSSGTGTKTVYVKFRDAAGNISPVYNDSIIWDTSIPSVTFSNAEGTYNTGITLSMTANPSSGSVIYYTLDGTTPTSLSGTLYTTGILIGTGISTYNFKVISIFTDNSGSINSEIYSRTYNFACPSIANASVTCTYPTYTFTCNSGYHVSGNSCVQDSVSSGGGGGGGGGGVSTDYCPKGDTSGSFYDGKCEKTTTSSTGTTTSSSGTNSQTNTGGLSQSGTNTIEQDYFIDISNSFAKNYINSLYKLSVIGGYSDKTFKPENNTSRAEFLKMAIKSMNVNYLDTDITDVHFSDIDKDSWQAKIVKTALNLSIISPLNKYFYPNNNITRAEATKILLNTAQIKIEDVASSSFADVSGNLTKYIEKAKTLGLVGGQELPDGKVVFRPNDYITRAEVAKMVYRTMDLLKNNSNIEKEAPTQTQAKVKNFYSFINSTISLMDENKDVFTLQEILKHFGYFTYSSTGYFGAKTQDAFIKFAKDKLGIVSKGNVTKDNINSILELNW